MKTEKEIREMIDVIWPQVLDETNDLGPEGRTFLQGQVSGMMIVLEHEGTG